MDGLMKLSDQIRNGELAPSELMQQTLKRVEERRDINAIVALNRQHAVDHAREADKEVLENYKGPLHGIPLTVKDAFATKHLPTTFGTPVRYRCKHNAAVVDRLESAGAIIIGKSNLPTISFDWQCNHPRYGITRHPLNSHFSPGGSSGGAAAAVAAGIVPGEIGSDIAGSLRLPAGLCGVNSIRPTEGIVSLAGHMAIPFTRPLKSLIDVGPIARSIDDLEILFKAISDLDPPDTFKPLTRVGIRMDFPDARISYSVIEVIEEAISKLRQAGVEVIQDPPGIDYGEALRTWGHICGYELKHLTRMYMPRWLQPAYSYLFEWRYSKHLITTSLGEGMAMSKKDYLRVQARRTELMQVYDEHLQSYDALLTPVCGMDALPICKTGSAFQIDGEAASYADPFATYNAATATFGHPVVVSNAGYSVNNLPVGIQIHGRRYQDYQLLAHARAVELIMKNEPSLMEAVVG